MTDLHDVSYPKLSEKCILFVQDEISEDVGSFISFSSLLTKYLSWHRLHYTTRVESIQQIENMFVANWGPLININLIDEATESLKNKGWYGFKFKDEKFILLQNWLETYSKNFEENSLYLGFVKENLI